MSSSGHIAQRGAFPAPSRQEKNRKIKAARGAPFCACPAELLFRRTPAELDRRNLERFAQTLRQQVAKGAAFNCLVTGDSELCRLNRDFLGKDYPTDVLSFPEAQTDHFLGEIAISLPRARAQAAQFHHSIETEICILMLHGVLHLLGMDHETDGGRMARAEARWRKRLALPAGLIERVRA